MARLCGLKILLFWAGIICLANRQAKSADPTSQSQCSYTITPFKFGFQINITNGANGNYNLIVKEVNQSETRKEILQNNNQNSSFQTHIDLKPCVSYDHNLTMNGKDTCKHSDNKPVTTTEMTEADIKPARCTPGYLCYQSKWDISSVQITSNTISAVPCSSDKQTFCIKPDYNEICTNLTTTFTQQCMKSSFNLTEFIKAADFLQPNEINQTPPTKLPAKIGKLPLNCINLTIEYICSDSMNMTKNLSQLEPFTDYTCTGQIKENNVTIVTTTALQVKVDCDLNIEITNTKVTNSSIKLMWKTTSRNCQEVLPSLTNLAYVCTCKAEGEARNKSQPGERCQITGLKPFTDYTCEVKPTYKGNPVNQPAVKTTRTDVGVPGIPKEVSAKVEGHNTIIVTCPNVNDFNGPKRIYKATLLYNGAIQLASSEDKCKFIFKDLSYLTTYKLEVFTFNGRYNSSAFVISIDTLYDNKAVIGFLVFLIILMSVALLLVTYKIYVLKRRKSNDMSENMMLISTANDEENLLPVEPIAAEVLLETYKRKLADEGRLFLAEFQSIPRIFSRYVVKDAKKACNTSKNRYVDILPYDYNRVQLATGNGEAGCDYINASFIDIKCAQYWPSPDRETEIFEEFVVKLNSEDHFPNYFIRRLILTNLRRRVNAFKNFFSGPIIVHCSAGVGRTGTYIGIDAMMEGLEAEGRVDIYGYVVRLRRQRCLMVQVEAQYILIHQALLEHNQFGETEITLAELHSTLTTLKQKTSNNEPTLMEDEFEGYWRPHTFIAAQTPLPDTMGDFWSMVYQKKVSTIVMLSNITEGDQESDSVYWDENSKTFGDIMVEVASTDTSPTFIQRNMVIRHVKRKESRSVKQFQFLKWTNRELPEKPQDLTDMIKDIKQICGSSKSRGSPPIVVHCNDGSSRSGIFCALWSLLDSAESEKLVDVFQVVKTLRKERQCMISSMDQYQFLYDALEGVYPVQNGEVKAVQADDSVQIVNETKATKQQSASTTSENQQGAAESAPLVADGGMEDKKEKPDQVSSSPTGTTPLEDTSNNTTVTVEV
ncbi:hypothetical protein PAMA_001261 [Pampus argenteus]